MQALKRPLRLLVPLRNGLNHCRNLSRIARSAGLGKGNPAWETYKLEKYIQQSTDLLLCKVKAALCCALKRVSRGAAPEAEAGKRPAQGADGASACIYVSACLWAPAFLPTPSRCTSLPFCT